jgi:hypothetical protein
MSSCPARWRSRSRFAGIPVNYLIMRFLSPFTAHGKKPVPVDADPGSGVCVFRNIADLRRGIYKLPPEKPDPSGAFLDEPAEILAHDHGSPLHPNYYVYQNTFLMRSGGARGAYAFTWGAHTHGTARRVFNNPFVQSEGAPRNIFTALSAEDDFQSDANLFWSLKAGGTAVVGNLREVSRVAAFCREQEAVCARLGKRRHRRRSAVCFPRRGRSAPVRSPSARGERRRARGHRPALRMARSAAFRGGSAPRHWRPADRRRRAPLRNPRENHRGRQDAETVKNKATKIIARLEQAGK